MFLQLKPDTIAFSFVSWLKISFGKQGIAETASFWNAMVCYLYEKLVQSIFWQNKEV